MLRALAKRCSVDNDVAAEEPAYRQKTEQGVRVLFAFGVMPAFFELEGERIFPIVEILQETFRDLEGTFGVRVLGTLDDDETMVGPSLTWPWTCYILAHAPDWEAARAVCNLVRETKVGDDRLWKFLRVEARVGRPLFFGEP
jgi:hypothetical protein